MGNQPTKHNIVNQTGRQKKYVHWKSAEVPSAPGRPVLIPVSDQQPDVITLQWEKPQSDGGSPVLGYIIEHRRIGATSWLRSVPILIVKNEASISGLEPGWKYQFRATAENVVGRSQPSILSDPLPISLQMRNANTLPKFITELKDTNAIENERLELRVRVFGNPQPEISWFKDGFEIFSSRRIKIVNENDFSSLIIHQVALTDEGEIKCTATNRAGHVVTKAKLIVEAPPKIRLPRNYEDGLIIEEDDVLKLKAGIAGQPFPAVIWSREGKVISDGSKFEIATTDKHTLLKIGKVKRIDRGEYSIRAVSKLGEDIASFLVTVTAKPRSPGKVQIVKSHKTSVTLSWSEPEDDGGCKIGSYIVEYFRIGWDVWLKATSTRQLQATLKDLIEGSEYKFRVKAENPYGVSEPSPESDILYLRSSSSQQIPTETAISITDNLKSIPPSNVVKKPVEPPRSPNRPNSPRTIKPELFESEQLNMEMSYGAPAVDSNTGNISKSNKVKEDLTTPPKPPASILKQKSPIPTPRRNHSNNLTLEISSSLASDQINRSPTPIIEITPTDDKVRDELVPLKRSVSPTPKSENNSTSTVKVESPTISRSNSPKIDLDNQIKDSTKTEAISETEQKIQERLKIEREKDEMKSSKAKTSKTDQASKQNGDINLKVQSDTILRRSFEYLFNKINNHEENEKKIQQNQNGNKKISDESSAMLTENYQNDLTDQQLSSDAEGRHRDEVHTSNEYMLVFYPDGREKDMEESISRNYFTGDNQGPPTLSYSFPNLSTLDEFSFQVNIRRSASSTELLYEKAMARFYEAVELEEEKKDKKKILNTGDHTSLQKTHNQNLDSIAESQEIFSSRQLHEKRNGEKEDNTKTDSYRDNNVSLNTPDYKEVENKPLTIDTQCPVNRRNIVEMTQNQHVTSPVDHSNDVKIEVNNSQYQSNEHEYKHFSDAEIRENTHKNSLFDDEKDIEVEYSSDYTESTASESESSMEYFRREVISRSSSGNIGRKKVTLSPVRYESDNDTLPAVRQIISNSSSDSIPKSILKKPMSAENIVSSPLSNPNSNTNLNTNVSSNTNLNTDQISQNNLNSEPTYYPIQSSVSNKFADLNSKSLSISNSNSFNNLKSNPNPNLNPNQNLYLGPHVDRRKSEDLKESPKLSPLSKAKSVSDKKLKGLKSFLTGGRSKSSKKKNESPEKDQSSKSQSGLIKPDTNKSAGIITVQKKNVKPEPDEGASVIVDYYSNIVQELGHSRYKTPLYLDTEELKRQSERAKLEDSDFKHSSEIDADEDLLLMHQKSKPRMSIVERMQTQHVRPEKSSHCIDTKIVVAELPETPIEEKTTPPNFDVPSVPEAPPTVKKVIKTKKIIKKVVRPKSRDTSKTRASPTTAALPSIIIGQSDLDRLHAVYQSQTETLTNEEVEQNKDDVKTDIVRFDEDETMIDAQENVRSVIGYLGDLGLFIFACWVYLFKDAYMVLPILALIVYRRIGEAIKRNIPSFLRRKPC